MKHFVAQLIVLATLMTVASQSGATSGPPLAGQPNMGSSGDASYALPIALPGGVGGVVPSLALQYSSQAGNGLAGYGWNLGGLSSIARCSQNVDHDGPNPVRGVKFTSTDKFCLDGARLLVVSGAYGAAGSEYRTEQEGYAKVTAYGAVQGAPTHFVVKLRNGHVMEYGATADSRIEAQGKTVPGNWALSKHTDPKGNTYSVSYTEDSVNGWYYPSRIDYTANALASPSVAARYAVLFEYESRPDFGVMFTAGSQSTLTKRLKAMKINLDNVQIASYTLAYGATEVTALSRLSTITYCAASSCSPPLSVSYLNGAVSWSSGNYNPISPISMNGSSAAVYFGDWNGDGHIDSLLYDETTGKNRWFIANGAFGFVVHNDPITPASINATGSSLSVGDWNGDGISDVVWYEPQSGYNRWYINNGALQFTLVTNPIGNTGVNGGGRFFIGDWNGDGISDVLWYQSSGLNRWFINNGSLGFTLYNSPISTAAFNDATDLYFGDWNGDGVTDVMWWHRAYGYSRFYLNNGNMTFTQHLNPIPNNLINGAGSSMSTGDWNGDGISDVMWFDNLTGANRWFVGNGSMGFTTYLNPIDPQKVLGSSALFQFGDWNGDGMIDPLWYDPSGGLNRWFINKGNMSFALTEDPIATSALNGGVGSMYVGDWNSDGVSDVMWHNPSTGDNRWYLVSGDNGWRTSMVSASVPGTDVSFAYDTLTRMQGSAGYTRSIPSAYPRHTLALALKVVSTMSSGDGVGGTRSAQYSYGNYVVDVSGTSRGGLGFQWTQTKDVSTGLVSRTYYRQDFPYIGMVDKAGKGTSEANWSNLSLSTNEYKFMSFAANDATYVTPTTCADDATGKTPAACASTAIQPGRRYVSYAWKSLSKAWDWNDQTGVFIALPQTRTTITQDNWSNATQVYVETLNAAGATTGYTKKTDSVYAPADTVNWKSGRLLKSSVTTTSP